MRKQPASIAEGIALLDTTTHTAAHPLRLRTLVSTLAFIALCVLVAYLLVDALPTIREIWANRANEAASVADFQKLGLVGIALLVVLQMLITMSAVLPDMPIQVLAGLVYGKWSILICLVGMLLANALLFLAARYGGEAFNRHFSHTEHPHAHHPASSKLLSIERLREVKHPGWLVFLINLIPGFPNGMLPLAFGQNGMSLPMFLLFVALGELPSLAISTGLGSSLASGHRVLTVGLGVLLVVVVALAYRYKDRLATHINTLSE